MTKMTIRDIGKPEFVCKQKKLEIKAMTMKANRRDSLAGAGLAALATMAGECASRFKMTGGGSMRDHKVSEVRAEWYNVG